VRRKRRSAKIRRWLAILIAATAVGFGASGAQAQDKAKPQPSIWERERLTGEWHGARTASKEKRVDIGIDYIGETFGILSGGLRRGSTYEGLLAVSVDTDLEKLTGWKGASTHITIFQIHNANGLNAADYVGSIADPSSIDAVRTTRLFTAWFQQNFLDDMISIRAGQLAADDEFFTSPTASGLINTTFGYGTNLSANQIHGGPAYPLATPGLRLQVNPAKELSILAALFAGDPAGSGCTGNPQLCNKYGTTFSTSGGALWMGELQYAVNFGKHAAGLPGFYKLGGWYATSDFADQRYGVDATGAVVSLASPLAVASLTHNGDWGIYGVADQMFWKSGERSINIFVRAGFSPSDRNLISSYVDGGFGIKGLIPGRGDDTLIFGVAHMRISQDAAALDRDILAIRGPPYPIRDAETVFELSYLAQITPWWTVQPDIQYIIHPGGNVPDPNNPNRVVGDALLMGVRTTIKF
jgi:porin